jgi:uncharacterized protein YaaN involved in tellurite resistance
MIDDSERALAEAMAPKIDVNDHTAIATLGAEVQQKVGDFADKFLDEVQLNQAGSVGDDLKELESVIKGAGHERVGARLRRVASGVPVLGGILFSLDGYFTSVRERVDEIMEKLESHQEQLLRDNLMFEGMRRRAIQNRHELLIVAAAGEIARENGQARLPEMEREARESGNPEKALVVQHFRDGLDRLDIQVTHLNEFAYAQLVAAPQMQVIVQTNLRLIDTINTQRALLVPFWKQTLAVRIGLKRQAEALEASEATKQKAREALQEASRMLREGAVGVARSASDPILGQQTLEQITDDLLATIQDLRTAREESAQAREQLMANMSDLTSNLSAALAGQATGLRQNPPS